ncbi:hypothetical protein [Parendozoicomonas haliclonae]|uniref:Uncharacterized protein n=1 Tax=Parendozoicomonas haliclonae TaxID=1960125 RepID=A0A1X7AN79_9GAMM|nr:hypothetical protein [Parendozoicomonas haliclonae]SMA49754.1 hypothetical protein EHSB41UT_03542 [Parendozoicomonas haliclonae]
MNENNNLPTNVRVLAAVISVPSVLLIILMAFQIYYGDWDISLFEVIYTLFGATAIYIAIVGKLPSFLWASWKRKGDS